MAFHDLEDPQDPPEPRRVTRLKCDRVRFNTDSCVPDPEALIVLRAVYQIFEQQPDLALLVASHTDKQASDESNQKLSNARSRSIVLLLTEDPEVWADHVVEHRKTQSTTTLQKDVDDVLTHFAAYNNWPDVKPPAAGRVKRFKELCDVRYDDIAFKTTNDQPDHDLWLCVALSYHHVLRDQLGLGTLSEMNDKFVKKVQWLDPEHPSIGCGERLPLITTGGEDQRENRRTEFLFFPKENRPTRPAKEAAVKAGQPPAWLEELADPKRVTFKAIKCPTPGIFKTPVHGNILFVIDCSGSMNAIIQAGRTRLELAKSQLVGCLQNLDENDRFGIVAYSSDYQPKDLPAVQAVRTLFNQDVSGKVESMTPLLRPAKPEFVDKGIAWVNALEQGGQTMTGPALEVAFRCQSVIEKEADGTTPIPMTVLLLTDGEPTPSTDQRKNAAPRDDYSKAERDWILKMIPTWNKKGWTLDVVGLLPNDESTTTRRFGGFLEALVAKSPVMAGGRKGTYTPWKPQLPPPQTKNPPKK